MVVGEGRGWRRREGEEMKELGRWEWRGGWVRGWGGGGGRWGGGCGGTHEFCL